MLLTKEVLEQIQEASYSREIRDAAKFLLLHGESALNQRQRALLDNLDRTLLAQLRPREPDKEAWERHRLNKQRAFCRQRSFEDGTLTSASRHTGTPFRMNHEDLMIRARSFAVPAAATFVTDFTDWIFGLYRNHNARAMQAGKAAESPVRQRRMFPDSPPHGWKVIYDGLGDAKLLPLKISALKINGKPLSAKPDAVLKNVKTGRLLIVEIKSFYGDPPSDGWPNLRAQLWAYAQIDEYRGAPDLGLIGEVWKLRKGCPVRTKTYYWSPEDKQFDREGSELFECYRRRIEDGS